MGAGGGSGGSLGLGLSSLMKKDGNLERTTTGGGGVKEAPSGH